MNYRDYRLTETQKGLRDAFKDFPEVGERFYLDIDLFRKYAKDVGLFIRRIEQAHRNSANSRLRFGVAFA